MRSFLIASLAATALCAALPAAAHAGGERVTFALPDVVDGATKRRGDFEARYLLFVYQGMP